MQTQFHKKTPPLPNAINEQNTTHSQLPEYHKNNIRKPKIHFPENKKEFKNSLE